MATLTGKITDVTGRAPDSISSITVKAPSVRVGSGTDVIVSSPAEVTLDKTTGDITISGLTGGISWLHLEGEGWSDSIALAVAEGMITLVEAIANAAGLPGMVDYLALIGSSESAINDIAQQAVDEASESIRWVRGRIYGENLNDVITPGVYSQHLSSYATPENNYPEQTRGTLTVSAWDSQTEGNVHQIFHATFFGRVYMRECAAGSWSQWREIVGDVVKNLGDLTTRNLDIVTDPGVYNQPLSSRATEARHYPATTRGILTVYQWGDATQIAQTYLTTFRGGMYMREYTTVTGWTDWAQVNAGATGGGTEPTGRTLESLTNNRREKLKHSSRLRRGGVIGTGGATPVALSFDHGYVNFRDKVLPHLQRLGLPSTSAFNQGQFGSGENLDISWSQLQDFALTYGVEMAHHAYSHTDTADATTNLDAIEFKLLSSIAQAESYMPELHTDAFIIPGVSGTGWEGFNSGWPDGQWWEHPAGRMILDNFPVISAKNRGYSVPMFGGEDMSLTSDRLGWDTNAGADTMRQQVEALYGTGMGVKIFMHPSQIDVSGKITEAKLIETLEWLADERDAGRIEVLTNSGFAYADTSTDRRLDLAPAGSWSGDNRVVTVKPAMDWVVGAQVILSTTAATSGPLTLSAVSDNGVLSTSYTHEAVAGQRYQLAFTIPRSATSITVTAPGDNRACVIA